MTVCLLLVFEKWEYIRIKHEIGFICISMTQERSTITTTAHKNCCVLRVQIFAKSPPLREFHCVPSLYRKTESTYRSQENKKSCQRPLRENR